jgi:hypothetical protein
MANTLVRSLSMSSARAVAEQPILGARIAQETGSASRFGPLSGRGGGGALS